MCKTSCAVCQTNARRWRDFHGERIIAFEEIYSSLNSTNAANEWRRLNSRRGAETWRELGKSLPNALKLMER